MDGWIAVDFDGTLATHKLGFGPEELGEPIPVMVERVKEWLTEGKDVRIFTARVAFDEDDPQSQEHAALSYLYIAAWCDEVFGKVLPITCRKSHRMIEMWDDKARRVEKNTGEEE